MKKKLNEQTKEALTRMIADGVITREDAEKYFHELTESEDSRMKQAFIRLVKAYHDVNFPTPEGFTRNDMLAWLEKQGEQKSKVQHIYNVGHWIVSKYGNIYQVKDVMQGSYILLCTSNAEEIDSISQVDNNFRLLTIQDIQKLENQGEQKPTETVENTTWSEEDERLRRKLIDLVYCVPYCDERKNLSDWLRTIKDRVQPKQEWSKEDEINRDLIYPRTNQGGLTMITIKSRAKDSHGIWRYGCYVKFDGLQGAIYYPIYHRGQGDKSYVLRIDWVYVEEDTVGRFIGLYDNCGKEIYEGDMLVVEGITKDRYAKVWWNDARFTFYIGSSPVDSYIRRSGNHLPEFRIAGNIYDNPGL